MKFPLFYLHLFRIDILLRYATFTSTLTDPSHKVYDY